MYRSFRTAKMKLFLFSFPYEPDWSIFSTFKTTVETMPEDTSDSDSTVTEANNELIKVKSHSIKATKVADL